MTRQYGDHRELVWTEQRLNQTDSLLEIQLRHN